MLSLFELILVVDERKSLWGGMWVFLLRFFCDLVRFWGFWGFYEMILCIFCSSFGGREDEV